MSILFIFFFNIYSFFYISLFLTDYSFILRKGISNIGGFTVLFVVLLFMCLKIIRVDFSRLFLFKAKRRLALFNDTNLLTFIFVTLTVVICILSSARHLSLSTTAWDSGLFDQAMWNTLHGNMLFSSIRGNMNLLGDHFEPILLLLVPFYAFWPSVYTIFIIQAFCLSLSVFPLYLIAKERLNSRLLIFAFIISYALSKGVRGIGLSDFHPECFMVVLTFFSFYFLIKKRTGLMFMSIFLLLLCKETAVLIPIALGLFCAFSLKDKRLGLTLIIIGLSAWILETKFIIPQFNTYKSYLFFKRMPFGLTYKENIQFLFMHPFKILAFVFMPDKISYIFKLLGPLGFFSLFSPSQYVLIIIPLSFILLASRELFGFYLITSHYVAHVLPFIYICAIYGVANAINFLKNKSYLFRSVPFANVASSAAIFIIISSLLFYGKTDAHKFNKFIDGINKNQSFEKIRYLSVIPDNASVSAVTNFVPHLSQRKFIYDFNPESPVSLATDYVVIDFNFIDYLNENTKKKIGGYLVRARERGYREVLAKPQQSFFILYNPLADRSLLENFRADLGYSRK